MEFLGVDREKWLLEGAGEVALGVAEIMSVLVFAASR